MKSAEKEVAMVVEGAGAVIASTPTLSPQLQPQTTSATTGAGNGSENSGSCGGRQQ